MKRTRPLTHTEIGDIFNRDYGGQPNFMTPHLECYGKKRHLIWEVSSGRGPITGQTMYGVTVLELIVDDDASYGFRTTRRRDLSQAAHGTQSLENLLVHIKAVANDEHTERKMLEFAGASD